MGPASAYVLLEDGTRFDGEAIGAPGDVVGEVVFTTGMAGYQESVTDPSFAGQLLTFTYPHIGNYGVSEAAMESDRAHARAAIMRAAVGHAGWLDWLAAQGVVGITGVDTRALTRHIRAAGSMRGGVFAASTSEAAARERIAGEPPMAGRALAEEVSRTETAVVGPEGGPVIAAIDTGIKASIIRNLVSRGARVVLHPARVSAPELLQDRPDAVFLANGPGDPAALDGIVETVRAVLPHTPVWGICLGHQLLSRAVGLETFKLPFGHRGANHPVKDVETGRIEITSQNHGFAVVGPDGAHTIGVDAPVRWETDFGTAQLARVNLYDRTVEGLTLLDVSAGTIQYHPEAGPGPNDALHLFDEFLGSVEEARRSRASQRRPDAAGPIRTRGGTARGGDHDAA
jgi:carbamoyl-phosphate synthase small subunit